MSAQWTAEKYGLGWTITRPVTPEEAEMFGLDTADMRPMSILGISADGLAVVMDETDARLIAAAPELLAALKSFIDTSAVVGDGIFKNEFKQARAAIARAEGGK